MSEHFKTESKIESELPAETRQQLNRLFLVENISYDEARDWLKEQGYDISRSSIGRYGKKFFEAYKKIKQFEDQAQTLKSDVGEGLLLEESLTKILLQKVQEAVIDGTMDVIAVPRILSDVAKLQSSSIQRERIKMDFTEFKKKAIEAISEVAKKAGISADTEERMRKRIMGIE